jgi:hypothetical protein
MPEPIRRPVTINLPLPLFQRLDRHCHTTSKQELLYPMIEALILALPEQADNDDTDFATLAPRRVG